MTSIATALRFSKSLAIGAGLFSLLFFGASDCKKTPVDPPINNDTIAPIDTLKTDTTDNLPGLKVSPDKEVVVFDLTATWCGNCGQYGHEEFAKGLAQNPSRINGLALHPSTSCKLHDPFSPALASSVASFNGGGFPAFAMDNVNFSNGFVSWQNAINAKLSDAGPGAGTALQAKTTDGKAAIDAKIQFFAPAAKTYRYAIYLAEDGVIQEQTIYPKGGGATKVEKNFVHNHVFRYPLLDSDVLGRVVAGSSFKDGDVRTFRLELMQSAYPSVNFSNAYVVGVLYEVDPSDNRRVVSVVNSNSAEVE